MVFCLERGWKDEEEAVEAREGVCNMTDILTATSAASKEDQATASDDQDVVYVNSLAPVSQKVAVSRTKRSIAIVCFCG